MDDESELPLKNNGKTMTILTKSKVIVIATFLACSSFEVNASDANQQGDLNTNTQDSVVDSYNTSSTSNTTNIGAGAGKPTPPPSAISPSYMSSGADTCLIGSSASIQTGIVGLSGGGYTLDTDCNRRRNAKVMNDLGMKIAAVALMCEDIHVWEAMFNSQSPCPVTINGKLIVGKQAYLMMKQSPYLLIPNYKSKKDYYDTVLGIGEEKNDENENRQEEKSISERFRSSSSVSYNSTTIDGTGNVRVLDIN
jgi:hypothetical protein